MRTSDDSDDDGDDVDDGVMMVMTREREANRWPKESWRVPACSKN